ncbi:adhesion G protein-coupled receptor L3-like [Haliotis rubra]|uniref:adhesion G protein-coupled receptor L3-like n=1 Tax=Haliotis rubra TaxID=36100 RepID=UPI001EE58C37|nr:adhesion G protein-coupled receptor L3-like [Haliotis rubra]
MSVRKRASANASSRRFLTISKMDSSWIYCVICALVIFPYGAHSRRRREEEQSCGSGWVVMHRACYKFDTRKMSWEDARNACRQEGGTLISISSKAEKKKVVRELKKQITKDDMLTWWVGLKWHTDLNKFIWQDGGTFSRRITQWGPGEPNNGRGRSVEHCVEIRFNGFLNDRAYETLRPFICERHEITQRPTFQTTVEAVTSTSTTIATTSATTASTTTTTTTTTTTQQVVTTKPTEVPSTEAQKPTTQDQPKTQTQTQTTPGAVSTSRVETQSVVETSSKTSPEQETSSKTSSEQETSSKTSSEQETSSKTSSEQETSSKTSSEQVTSSKTSSEQETSSKPETSSSTTTKPVTSPTVTTSTSPKTSRVPPTTPVPNWRTTLSVLTSTTWEEKLSPFHGCFELTENNKPVNSDGMASAALMQQYKRGATTCPEAYASNMNWPATVAGTFAEIKCRSGSGTATWRCGSNPTCWRGEPNLAGCASPKFKKILKKVLEASVEEANEEEQVKMTTALVEVTKTEEMSVEDVMLTSKVIQSLATQSQDSKPKDEKAVKSIVKNVVKAGSNVVSENKSSTWEEMAPEDKARSASNLLVAIESTTVAMAAVIDHPTVIEAKDENIDLELHVIDVENMTEDALTYDDEGSDNVISIPVGTLKSLSKGGLAKAVFMTHYKMADLLEERPSATDEKRTRTKIASSILSASIGTDSHGIIQLSEPITFTMKLTQEIPGGVTPKCSFWDIRQDKGYGRWSQDGCRLAGTNNTHTTCKCDHLTNFAILMDVEGVEMHTVHKMLLEFITLVGCIISILCLFASWITFTCFGSLQGERNSIHKNLVVCLWVAEILFITGVSRTENKLACTLIAGFLHYFFLSVFMWMFIEGIHMVIMLVQVFDAAKSRLPYYYMTGYGIPLIIVSISAGFYYQGYGTDQYCWLTTDRFFIWSFAGPVALILLVNAIILTYAMVMVCRHSEYVLNSKEKNSGGMRTWLQGALSMEVLLGLTWTFGYFYISKETIALAYIFTILNSLQGLFIFCFHCLLNKKVLKEYKRILHISKKRPSASTQSASLMRKQSQSCEMSSKSRKDSSC